jgi:hypothetical protein
LRWLAKRLNVKRRLSTAFFILRFTEMKT